MTCVVAKPIDNACNFDYQLALSVATILCNNISEAACKEWEEESKCAGAARSSSSSACAASSCAAAFASTDLPLAGPEKAKLDEDWCDDRSTVAASRSDRSMCDEQEDFDLAEFEIAETEPTQSERPARKLTWAELVDSDTEEDTNSVDADGGSEIGDPSHLSTMTLSQPCSPSITAAARPARWADISESDEENMENIPAAANVPAAAILKEATEPEPQSARSSRASRRARAASAAAAAAATDDSRSTAASEEQGPAARVVSKKDSGPSTAPGKGVSKGSGKKGSEWARPSDKNANWGAEKYSSKGSSKGAAKGAAKGAGKAAGKGGKAAGKGASKGAGKGKGSSKFQCQIIVGIEEDNKFRVVRRLIGSGGENMKNINQDTQARLRLRGRGSKFLEGDEQQESTDDLMLCITSDDAVGYERAKAMASELIEGIHHSYRSFCIKANKVCPDLKFQLHEGYREGSR